MNASNKGPASVRTYEQDLAADCGPMAEQNTGDAHGRDMHPQKLVRLVGCHDVSVRKVEDAEN